MSTPTNPPIPEVPSHSNTGVGVRRHHTITAASRSARPNARDTISEEAQPQHQELWNDDEVVGEDWVGGVGAVGEKSGLHRQSSLPTKYHRGKSNLISTMTRSFSPHRFLFVPFSS